jgi:PilZ domain
MASLKLLVVEDDAPSLSLRFRQRFARSTTAKQRRPWSIERSLTAYSWTSRCRACMVLILPTGSESHRGTNRPRLLSCQDEVTDKPCESHFPWGPVTSFQKPVDRQKLSRLLRTVRGGMLQNRRCSARVSVHTELMCSIGMRTIRGMSWNLSQTGMQAEVFGLEPGNVVQLSFRLPPSRENIDATGVVVWVGKNRQGIQFKKMSAHNQELIRNFIGELEH